jgi:hypothetical protein
VYERKRCQPTGSTRRKRPKRLLREMTERAESARCAECMAGFFNVGMGKKWTFAVGTWVLRTAQRQRSTSLPTELTDVPRFNIHRLNQGAQECRRAKRGRP